MSIEWLAGPEGQAAIECVRGVDPLHARRALPGLAPEQVSAALTQAKYRPEGFPLPLVTVDGIQQATPTEVAVRRAERLAAAGVRQVVDAGCGIGVDAWAFQRAGLDVIAFEIDPHTAEVARANLPGVQVVNADVTDHDLPPGVLYVDPARRRAHQDIEGRPVRIHDPQQWSPPWSWVLAQAAERDVVARVRPGMGELPDGAEWCCTSIARSLVDASLWFGDLARHDRSAEVFDVQWRTLHGPAVPARIGEVKSFIVDPDPAIVRSGLVTNAALAVDGHLIDEHLAYITCDRRPPVWLGRAMEVIEPVTRRDAARAIGRHSLSGVTVWCRGFTRPPLPKLPEGQDGVIVAARLGDDRATAMWLGRRVSEVTSTEPAT